MSAFEKLNQDVNARLQGSAAKAPAKPALKLVGTDGNAFAVLGAAVRAARRAGWTPAQIKAYRDAATSGDYDHLLGVTMKLFDVS